MTFNVFVAAADNRDWAAIAGGVRRHEPDSSLLRVRDGEQAANHLFERGLFTEAPQTPDLVVLAADLPTVPMETIVARLREHPRTRTIPVIVVWRRGNDVELALGRQQWLERQQWLLIVGAETLARDVVDATRKLCGDSLTLSEAQMRPVVSAKACLNP